MYTSRIWDVSDGNGGENFEERMIDQIQQFFKELGTMNLLAQDHGVELTSQEKDSIKRLTEQYYGLLSKADREYIGAQSLFPGGFRLGIHWPPWPLHRRR